MSNLLYKITYILVGIISGIWLNPYVIFEETSQGYE